MQEATGSLSPEQKSVLGTVFHFLESATVYLQSVLPVVHEVDARMLEGLLELGEICLKRLPQYFPELEPLAEEWKKRGVCDEQGSPLKGGGLPAGQDCVPGGDSSG